MANARQKKKKNAAASKQAATAYKGKNAPIKPAAVKKPQETPSVPVPEVEKAEVVKSEPAKAEASKPAAEKAEQKKPASQKSEDKKSAVNKQTVNKAEAKKPDTKKSKLEKEDKAKKKEKVKKSSKSKASKKQPKKSGSETAKLKLGITKIAAIVLAVSVVIASVCVLMWVKNNAESKEIPPEAIPKYNGINISPKITLDVIEDLANQEEFANKMNREGDTEAFLYYASDELIFPEKNVQAPLNLVNVSSNKCVLIASIVDEAGNICFSSRGLLPGRMLTDIGINNQPYGRQEMTLVVAGYDPNTYELIGVQSSELTVQVGIEEETSYGQNN